MITEPNTNLWAITIVGKANRLVVISNVQAPIEIAKLIHDALMPKARVVSERSG